jgi:hypothetical protein
MHFKEKIISDKQTFAKIVKKSAIEALKVNIIFFILKRISLFCL